MRTFRQVGREKKGTFHELGLKSTKQKSKIAKKKTAGDTRRTHDEEKT